MNTKIALKTVVIALTFAFSVTHAQENDVVFGVPILDGAQHDYVIESGVDDVENVSSFNFPGFGVAILDEAEYDYVPDAVSDSGDAQYSASASRSFTGFGVAILDDAEHDYANDEVAAHKTAEWVAGTAGVADDQ